MKLAMLLGLAGLAASSLMAQHGIQKLARWCMSGRTTGMLC
jgi:hypothetical protein